MDFLSRSIEVQDSSQAMIQTDLSKYSTLMDNVFVPQQQTNTTAIFDQFGRSTKFSDSFNNMMYQDNSLWAASRLQQRLSHGQKQRELKRERERAKLQSLIDRRALAARYLQDHGIRVDLKDIERLTEKQLLIKLETRHAVCKENRAAIKIQLMTRRFIAKQKFLKMHEKRINAAKRI